MFAHREVRVGVGAVVTDRRGGTSVPPYDELNLADHVGDDPPAVAENRRLLAADLDVRPLPLVTMQQVHGADVAVVDDIPSVPPVADVLVTRRRGLALAVLVADCTPILLWDQQAGVVAAVHAGRSGLAAGVLPAAVAAMTDLGAQVDRVHAHLGPGICAAHYEVHAPMRDEVESAAPGSAAVTPDGRPALDIRAGLTGQLTRCGVRSWAVSLECTAESPRLYSHRRDGPRTGRFAGVVWLQP